MSITKKRQHLFVATGNIKVGDTFIISISTVGTSLTKALNNFFEEVAIKSSAIAWNK